VVGISTRTVQADARLPKPAAAPAAPAVPAVLALSATPASLGKHKVVEAAQSAAEEIQTASELAARSDKLRGVASWYGGVFNGRRTASGERFDMNAMTACHPTLPFGSVVRVTNQDNGRSVVVRITDRGYLYNGRILDLSYGAARKLAMIKPGVAQVELEVISLGKPRHRK
jgi:rare lipoprotein A